jgi:DNA primase
MIAPSSIQEVLDRADIAEIIGQFVRLKKRGAGYIANCPFHSEKTPSFHVTPSKGIFKCFGCGKGGNVVSFLQDHEKLSFPEAIKWLADYYKIHIEETSKTPEQQQQFQIEESLRILNDFATTYFEDCLWKTDEGMAIGLNYFIHRGFREATIRKFKLGYAQDDYQAFYRFAVSKGYNPELLEKAGLIRHRNDDYYDMYRGRVIFPIQNMTGRVVGFGARILKSNDKAPKYINTPENELYIKSKILYGMHHARQAIAKHDECFLVEGYTDVIALHQAGIENVVASSGTSLTVDQLRLLGQLTKNLTILYDGDAAGIKAALRGLDMAISQSFNVKLVLLPENEDPDSLVQKSGPTAFQEYIQQNKKDIIRFRLEIGLQDVGKDPVAKSQLVNEIAESISKINKAEDFSLQEYYIREASRLLQVEEAGMVNLVNKYIRTRLDQERRIQEREQQIQVPQAEELVTEDEVLQKKEIISAEERQEWEMLRVLIEYGNKPIEETNTVANYIQERVDPDLIESDLVSKLFEQYYNYLSAQGGHPSASHFLHYGDREVQQRIASLLQTDTGLSPNWSLQYGIEILSPSMNYINEVESALAYFELKKIIRLQEEVMGRMVHEKDDRKIAVLQKKFMELHKAENEIVRKHGTVVFRILKKEFPR